MKTFVVAGLLTLLTILSACNTMHGLGEDVESGGEKIQKSSDHHY